nr:hypothetical protein [Nanoarchaeum sp.]
MINVMQSLEITRNSFENNIDDATLTKIMHLYSSAIGVKFAQDYPFSHLHQGKVYFKMPSESFRIFKSRFDIEKTKFYEEMVDTFEQNPYDLRVNAVSDPAVLVRIPNPNWIPSGDIVRIIPDYLAFNPAVALRLRELPGRKSLNNLETAIDQDRFLQEIMHIHAINR